MASSNASMQHGILVRQWTWPIRAAFWCLLIALGAWWFTVAMQWLWAHRSAPEAPVAYATAVLEDDLAALAQLQPQLFQPDRLARWIGDGLHDSTVMVALLASRTVMNVPGRSREHFIQPKIRQGADAGGDFVKDQMANASEHWQMAVVGTYVFAARTAMYAAALPLIALAAVVGAADGLVARSRRKACAGRESASLYHRAKLGVSFSAIMGYLVCLGVPSLGQSVTLLAPVAIVLALLLRLQCAYYKKYL